MTFFASVGGAILGVAALGLGPLVGLSGLPYTLFGSCVVLLPTYLWWSDHRKASRRSTYAAVFASGVIGGVVLIALLTFLVAGSLLPASNGMTGWNIMDVFKLHGLGALFGGLTAACWLVAHHFTRGKSRIQEVR